MTDQSNPTTPDQPNPHWPAHLQPPPYTPNPAQPTSPTPYSPAAAWPYQAGPYPPPYAPLVRPTSGLATASLIFGIAGLFLFCLVIPSLVAVLLGHTAIKETRGGHKGGHGQAIAGLILGYVVMIPAVIWLALGGLGMLISAIEGTPS